MPSDDLVLLVPLIVMFVIPSDYNVKGGLKVYCSSPKLFRIGTDDSHTVAESNEVVIPWLQACKRKHRTYDCVCFIISIVCS